MEQSIGLRLDQLTTLQNWRQYQWWGGPWVQGSMAHDGAVELFVKEYLDRLGPEPTVFCNFGCGAWLEAWSEKAPPTKTPSLAFHSVVEDHLVFAKNLLRLQQVQFSIMSKVGVYPSLEGIQGACLRIYKDMEWNHRLIQHFATQLPQGSWIHLFGRKDDGISALEKRIKKLGLAVEVRAVGCHSRWIAFTANAALSGLNEGRTTTNSHEIAGFGSWESPEGVFAAGRIDPGTALLLENAGSLKGARVWDFGCGSAILAAHAAQEGANFVLATDHSILSVEAATRNLKPWSNAKAQLAFLSDGVQESFDVILTNPPFHREGVQDNGIGRQWLAGALDQLAPSGEIRVVCNSFLKYGEFSKELGLVAEKIAERSGFIVYGIRRKNMV